MSDAVLEMYLTLDEANRFEVDSLIERLVKQQIYNDKKIKDEWEEIFATADRLNTHSVEDWKREDLYRD